MLLEQKLHYTLHYVICDPPYNSVGQSGEPTLDSAT